LKRCRFRPNFLGVGPPLTGSEALWLKRTPIFGNLLSVG
jgi:hypothetical protein